MECGGSEAGRAGQGRARGAGQCCGGEAQRNVLQGSIRSPSKAEQQELALKRGGWGGAGKNKARKVLEGGTASQCTSSLAWKGEQRSAVSERGQTKKAVHHRRMHRALSAHSGWFCALHRGPAGPGKGPGEGGSRGGSRAGSRGGSRAGSGEGPGEGPGEGGSRGGSRGGSKGREGPGEGQGEGGSGSRGERVKRGRRRPQGQGAATGSRPCQV